MYVHYENLRVARELWFAERVAICNTIGCIYFIGRRRRRSLRTLLGAVFWHVQSNETICQSSEEQTKWMPITFAHDICWTTCTNSRSHCVATSLTSASLETGKHIDCQIRCILYNWKPPLVDYTSRRYTSITTCHFPLWDILVGCPTKWAPSLHTIHTWRFSIAFRRSVTA